MKLHDITHNDGSRSMQIRTACGFEITLMRTVEGKIKEMIYFNNTPVTFSEGGYSLSHEGAEEYAKAKEEIYGA